MIFVTASIATRSPFSGQKTLSWCFATRLLPQRLDTDPLSFYSFGG